MTPLLTFSPLVFFFVGNKGKHDPPTNILLLLFSFNKNVTPIPLLTFLSSCFLFLGNKTKQNLPYLHKPNLVLFDLKQSKNDLVQDHHFQYLPVQHYHVQYHSVQYHSVSTISSSPISFSPITSTPTLPCPISFSPILSFSLFQPPSSPSRV